VESAVISKRQSLAKPQRRKGRAKKKENFLLSLLFLCAFAALREILFIMDPRTTYTLFMFLGLAVFLIARHFVPKPAALERLPWTTRLSLALAAFVGGTFGAKL